MEDDRRTGWYNIGQRTGSVLCRSMFAGVQNKQEIAIVEGDISRICSVEFR